MCGACDRSERGKKFVYGVKKEFGKLYVVRKMILKCI
jgi:hypothetical protein